MIMLKPKACGRRRGIRRRLHTPSASRSVGPMYLQHAQQVSSGMRRRRREQQQRDGGQRPGRQQQHLAGAAAPRQAVPALSATAHSRPADGQRAQQDSPQRQAFQRPGRGALAQQTVAGDGSRQRQSGDPGALPLRPVPATDHAAARRRPPASHCAGPQPLFISTSQPVSTLTSGESEVAQAGLPPPGPCETAQM